jgi:SAM-dependent methyltransferase
MAAEQGQHWWFVGRRRILAAMIAHMGLKPSARLLEVGSGMGGNLAMLAGFGHVTAVEMDDGAREYSRTQAVGADVRGGKLPGELGLGAETFDLICLFDVLEHVEDDAGALLALKPHMAPHARLLLTVPAHPNLFGPHDLELHHKRRYSRTELVAKLKAAGFGIERVSYMNALLLPVAFVLRGLDRLLGRERATASGVPAAPVNNSLAALFGAEALVLPKLNLPVGLSLMAVARLAD